jgi:diguanylate cyclase (GGDEF)-like protein
VPPGGPDPWRGPRGNLYRADGVTPLPPGELPLHRALLENDHVGDVELVIAPPGGPRRTVVTNARVVRAPDGTLLGAVSAARDMTEERRLAAERERLLRALADQAEQDELTGLLNRRGFRRTAAQERRSAARTGRRDAVCYVDLDRFKPINDRYGHAAGDAALRAVADLLRATIRDADFAARLGGDEFAVYAVGINGPGEAAVLAGRLRAALAAHNRDAAAAGRPYALAFSVGVAEFAPDEPLDAGLARADSALYAAKPSRGGR